MVAGILMTQYEATALGTFDGRYTMRHSRIYDHEIDHVWAAITTSHDFDVWFMPISIVEPTLGAACSFSFGGPQREAAHGSVNEMTPPTLINYQCEFFAHRFELAEVEGGTQCHFLQVYSPDFRHLILDAEPTPDGFDLPAGIDVAWRPGMVAGYHVSMDNLSRFLDSSWRPNLIVQDNPLQAWAELVEVYRAHIRDNCPQA